MSVPVATSTEVGSRASRPQRGRRRAKQKRRITAVRVLGALLLVMLAVVAVTVLLLGRPSSTEVAAADVSHSVAAAASSAATAPAADTLTGVGGSSGVFPVATVQTAAPNATLTLASLTTSDGLVRSYLVASPKAATGDLPLIVVLHGQNAAATQEALRTDFLPLVNAGHAILVYPAGYLQSWNVDAAGCCGQAAQEGLNDVSFIAAVVGAVKGSFAVAKGQVYLVGYSNGGKMAYDVMCRYPLLFRGFATVSATPLTSCSVSAPPPASALIIVGSADPELPTTDTPQDPATLLDATATVWRQNDSCSVDSQSATQGIATITTWGACRNSTQVQTAIYAGATHGWPVAIAANSTPSAATLIWNFFSSLA